VELIHQHAKGIMEGCKERAKAAGLRFHDETLEYIVTNRDLIELSPKLMIPTLYDYWIHDVEVLKEKGRYELYPTNPYETVINTRPVISFYNENNPDWLNVMIFYHVLAHIDFFQNNLYFRHTWDDDFTGQALSDKRLIAKLRSEKGRWVDYVIEFARGIDNLVGYHTVLSRLNRPSGSPRSRRLDFYFDIFLQDGTRGTSVEYLKEIERYNDCLRAFGEIGETAFFSEVNGKHPELEVVFKKWEAEKRDDRLDLLQFIQENSEFLNKGGNNWMKPVIEVVRKTSLFFQPQIRTKIMNEGWASYWHEALFLKDDRINGHEVDFAKINAGVTALPRIGINPYGLGLRLFQDIEEGADRGKYSFEFLKLLDIDLRKKFDAGTGCGRNFIFKVRENFCDFTFLHTFVDQDFVTKNRLFVSGKRLNRNQAVWEYYVKSRNAEDYRRMLFDSLYHPPHIVIGNGLPKDRAKDNTLCLVHRFEGKPLVADFIGNTMLGIEYFWGGPVWLETTEPKSMPPDRPDRGSFGHSGTVEGPSEITWQKVLYTMENRKLSKQILGSA